MFIALIFSIVCIVIDLFFLDTLVSTNISMNTVRVFFVLFGASFVVNYLTYYKRSLLYAEQKNRISIGVTALCEIIFRGYFYAFRDKNLSWILAMPVRRHGNQSDTVIL